jgi:hypothetical protein
MKSQLLINHRFMLIKQKIFLDRRTRKNQANFWEYPPFFLGYPINFCFYATDERGLLKADAGVSAANQIAPGREDLWAELVIL